MFLHPSPQPPAEKKIPNAPRRLPPTPPAPPAPSAPRAMAGGGSERNNKGEITSGRDRHRDGREQLKGPPPNAPTAPDPSRAANSLRSRISEKEGSLSHPPPQGPGGYRGGESSSSVRHEDDRDGGRKRTASGKLLVWQQERIELRFGNGRSRKRCTGAANRTRGQ